MKSHPLSCLFFLLVCSATVCSGCGPNHFLPLIFEEPVVTCPQLEDCALNCRYGLAKNQEDCPVCECQYHPCTKNRCKFPRKVLDYVKPCREVDDCDRRFNSDECTNIVCQTYCLYGLRKGSDGCRICACDSSPCNNHTCAVDKRCKVDLFSCSEPPCDPIPKCVKVCPLLKECNKSCEMAGFKRDEDDCRLCECKQNACDNVKCPVNQNCTADDNYAFKYKCACVDLEGCNKTCQYGFERDVNGCGKCECVQDPCKGVKCPCSFFCQPTQLRVCLQKPCPFKARCVPLSKEKVTTKGMVADNN